MQRIQVDNTKPYALNPEPSSSSFSRLFEAFENFLSAKAAAKAHEQEFERK